MSKIAVVTDTNSGMTNQEAKELGVSIVPMPFRINDEDYLEGINLTQDEFYHMLSTDATVTTSMPSPGNLMNIWDDLLKTYDEIVYIPMSSGLSSSCQTATMLAEDEDAYNGKVFVVNNQRISVTQRQSVLDALELIEHGFTGAQIKEKLEEEGLHSSIYIMLDTLYYLKKGGRITPAAAAIGTLLRLKPVLQIQGEKLDAFAKARTAGQGRSIMLNAVKNDIDTRFGGVAAGDAIISVAYSHDLEKAEEWKKEVEAFFPGYEIHMDPLSLSVSCHIGPGALAVTATRKMHI